MDKRLKPSKQVDAAFKMGQLETRVALNDSTLKALDFTNYLSNCEKAELMADNKVLKYLLDTKLINSNVRLKRAYDKYKSKYWK